jgi:hypothetical protein
VGWERRGARQSAVGVPGLLLVSRRHGTRQAGCEGTGEVVRVKAIDTGHPQRRGGRGGLKALCTQRQTGVLYQRHGCNATRPPTPHLAYPYRALTSAGDAPADCSARLPLFHLAPVDGCQTPPSPRAWPFSRHRRATSTTARSQALREHACSPKSHSCD